MNFREVVYVIEDYKKLMAWATPEDADAIDAAFWGSWFLPSHLVQHQAIIDRARAAILEKAKNGKAQTDKGSEGPQKSPSTKRT